MSNTPPPPSVVSPYGSLQTATRLNQRFCSLSAEIKVMILCTMTAAELIDFRRCCIAFNGLFTEDECAIIRGVLRNPSYRPLSTLYDAFSAPGPLKFKCLEPVARRCSIVEKLATAIAELDAREGLVTSTKMAKNLKPYLIALGHFFEEYRTALANYPYDRYGPQSLNWARDNVDGEVLKAHYNEKAAQRLCLTYELVKRTLEQKIPRAMDGLIFILRHIRNPPSRNNPPAEIYTFGGLETNTDILTHPQPTDRHAIVPLPLCVYGSQLNRATTSKVCRLFPLRRRLLQLSQLAGFGFAAVTDEEEVEMRREFLEFFRSGEGQEELELVRG